MEPQYLPQEVCHNSVGFCGLSMRVPTHQPMHREMTMMHQGEVSSCVAMGKSASVWCTNLSPSKLKARAMFVYQSFPISAAQAPGRLVSVRHEEHVERGQQIVFRKLGIRDLLGDLRASHNSGESVVYMASVASVRAQSPDSMAGRMHNSRLPQ